MHEDALAPRQQRSRETLGRLLNATLTVLESSGLDGATIPRIAAAAGVAPASVYRRFRDKEALFRAAFLHALKSSAGAGRDAMRLESFKSRTLDGVASEIVAALSEQYRTRSGMLQALLRFAETADTGFQHDALAMIAGNFQAMIDVLLNFRSEIGHANPKRAIAFALLNVVSSTEMRAFEQDGFSVWRKLLPVSEKEIQQKLTRLLVLYLRGALPRRSRAVGE